MGDINLTNQISVNHTSGTSITVTNNIAVTGAPGSETGGGPGQGHQAGPSCSKQGVMRGGGMEDDDICPSPQVSEVEPEARQAPVGPQEGAPDVKESPPQSSVCESEDRVLSKP